MVRFEGQARVANKNRRATGGLLQAARQQGLESTQQPTRFRQRRQSHDSVGKASGNMRSGKLSGTADGRPSAGEDAPAGKKCWEAPGAIAGLSASPGTAPRKNR